ncbi:low molecular weight phosphatase family protein [Halococcus salsus]|uniref:arsenate-mycothiol transferase ArsC n=1 Tax=Halococcus salsus TaxID=2162894 RepID=UPI00135A712C|nr:low molecular weight phosphatase family protein [Halococcus salsus]
MSNRSDGPRVAFVCVQNAGRSQMASAFAERERDQRGLDEITILTGGTHPADGVHDEVVEVMHEAGIDLSGRTPREITDEELDSADYVATMGCSTLDLDAGIDVRDWDLPDPHGADVETVRSIREEVRERVASLFDEFEAESR